MTALQRLLDILTRLQLVLIIAALGAGLIWPAAFLPFKPWNSFLLQLIMFATGLRLNFRDFVHEAKDWRTLVLANATMLILLPFLVAIPLSLFAPDWILPFVLAAAMPTGLTAPSVVSILEGSVPLAILISISTSLLSPLTIPLVLRVTLGQSVTLDTTKMMINIASVVILPLLIAAVIQWKLGKNAIEKVASPIRLVNLIAFVLIIASVTASSGNGTQAGGSFLGIGRDGLIIVILMTIFWIGIAWLASAILAWRNASDRMTVAFCLVYMNTTLGIWIADTFFHDTGFAPKLVAVFVATTIVLPAFKFFVPKHKRHTFHHVYAVEQT